ncbi:MAG: tetratricopeptide repeat protein [Coleofasciculaceae cyanobacterium RL_1_1]|nr:tetratricopeptide repeat protein [Coleofasciculaceae cyanobacterium RL_1_1]
MIGQLLDRRYRIVKVLGSGSFGQTYLAADLRRPGMPKCVVKQLVQVREEVDGSQTAERLFKQEAETLEKLGSHDSIPRLLAYFEEKGQLYLVKEYVNGQPLTEEIVPGQPLSESEVAAIVYRVLEILEFIHAEDVIHRDVKPENLIRRSEDNEIVLIDFGSVKELSQQIAGEARNRTIAAGTPVYMPVEQFQGNPQFNSDIYALGAIAVQALTGVSANNLPKLQDRDGIMQWRDRASGVSDEFAVIIDRMVAYSTGQRYQSARDVLDDLDPLMSRYLVGQEEDEEPIKSVIDHTAPPPKPLWKLVKEKALRAQNRVPRMAGFTLLALLAVLGVFWFWQYPSAGRAQAFYQRGLQKVEEGDEPGALLDFDRAIDLNPDDANAYYKRANVHFDMGNYEMALADYSTAIKLNPNDSDAYFNRGLAQMDMGNLQGAITDFSSVLQLNPNDPDAYYHRGLASHDVDDFQSSIQDYTQAILLDAENPYPYISRGLAHSALGDKQKAIADYTQAIRVAPEEPDAYYSRGRALSALGNYQGALEDYSKTIELDPKNVEAYTNRCSVQLNLGQVDAAIDDCSQAITIDRSASIAYTNRCVAYYQLQKYPEAIADCSRTIELNPESAKGYSNRGLSYAAQQDFERAIVDYSKAIELDPDNAVAYSNRGSAYNDIGEYRKAIEDHTQALRLNPNFAGAYFNRALVRQALNDRAGAIDDLQRAGKTCLDQGQVSCYNNAQEKIQELGGAANPL